MLNLNYSQKLTYIPIGHNCYPANTLRRLGIRSEAYPFDWIVCPLESVVRLFASMLNQDILCLSDLFFAPPVKRTQVVGQDGDDFLVDNWVTPCINKKYGIIFPHDFSLNYMDDYDLIRQKYSRRFDRLKEKINSSDSKIFLYSGCIGRINHRSSLNEFQRKQFRVAGFGRRSPSFNTTKSIKDLQKITGIEAISVPRLQSIYSHINPK